MSGRQVIITNVAPIPPGGIGHVYLSTACAHGLHEQCGNGMRTRGEPGEPHCKFCPAVCICADPACWHAGAARLASGAGA
jgi:hypothetical protein